MKCFVITFSKNTYLRLNPKEPPADWTHEKPLYGYRALIWTRKLIDAEKFLTAQAAEAFGERYLKPDTYGIADIDPLDYTRGTSA